MTEHPTTARVPSLHPTHPTNSPSLHHHTPHQQPFPSPQHIRPPLRTKGVSKGGDLIAIPVPSRGISSWSCILSTYEGSVESQFSQSRSQCLDKITASKLHWRTHRNDKEEPSDVLLLTRLMICWFVLLSNLCEDVFTWNNEKKNHCPPVSFSDI